MGLYVCSPVVQVSQLIVVLERLVDLMSVPVECKEPSAYRNFLTRLDVFNCTFLIGGLVVSGSLHCSGV